MLLFKEISATAKISEQESETPIMTDLSGSHPAVAQADITDRPMRPAMIRGWKRRCPNCGKGRMLSGYLKVRDTCTECNEALHHHRADDGPAYLTILIVGHLMAPTILYVFTTYRPAPIVLASTFTLGCVALSLYLLPRLKGVVVAIQWAKRMHGFDDKNV